MALLLGLLAQYTVGASLQLAIQMAAVMVLMPMVVKLIMEGLIPISEAARNLLDKHFKGSDLKIGLDPALLLGDSQVIAASLIFVPLTVFDCRNRTRKSGFTFRGLSYNWILRRNGSRDS